MPRFAKQTFEDWYRVHVAERTRGGHALNGKDANGSIILFPDTFMNYFEPEIGVAAVDILESADFPVATVPYVCCGRPLISQGMLDDAKRQAVTNLDRFWPAVNQGASILFCEPSCLSAMRDDVPALLRGADRQRSERVAQSCVLFEEFLEQNWSADRFKFDLKAGPVQVLLHGHCHQKAMGLVTPAVALMSRIPRCKVIEPDAGCCGMAGSFGYLEEHFEISRRIAERRLVPAVRDLPAGTPVVASGTSCRHQIRQFTGIRAVHPATLLRSLLR